MDMISFTESSHHQFGSNSRVSQSLCNDRCQNILYKAVFEHLEELKWIAALLLTSKSFQNSSFGANFVINFVVDKNSIGLLESVLSPSACFSLQFVPSLYIRQWWNYSSEVERSISNFARELVNSKYFHLSLRSLTVENVTSEMVCLFFESSKSNAWPQLRDLTFNNCGLEDTVLELISNSAIQLRAVNFAWSPRITNVGLEHISKLSNITSLHLSNCHNISDAGLHHLSNLSSLSLLDLCSCDKITDAGLEYIANLSSLTSLDLSNCNLITDAGLEHVAKLSVITSLYLYDCASITEDAKQKFKTEVPNCEVE